METPDAKLIDALGGTTAVARLTETPISTVHSWRKNGIPRSRIAHLRLASRDIVPAATFEQLVGALGGAAPVRASA